MFITWIIGMMIGNALFPSSFISETSAPSNQELILFMICFINAGAVLLFIHHSNQSGWNLIWRLIIVIFSIQFFMSQIESIWFNDSLKMPLNLIWAIMCGGLIMSVLFAPIAAWLTGRFKSSSVLAQGQSRTWETPILPRIAFLSILVWPIVYFTAGYLLPWQISEVRNYYTGSTEMQSLWLIMEGNFRSGLYFFQILRGVLWIMIGNLVLNSTNGSLLIRGIVLGILLMCLGCSQLLLPNPIMPAIVRIPHLIETSLTSIIWGILLAYFLKGSWFHLNLSKHPKERYQKV